MDSVIKYLFKSNLKGTHLGVLMMKLYLKFFLQSEQKRLFVDESR